MRRLRIPVVVALGGFAALAMSASSAGAGCAQIIGADFDKPFATGGGGATSASGTTSSSMSGSTSTSDASGSTSTGPGPLCGNGTCGANEDANNCPVDCPVTCGDAICSPGETVCSCDADCDGSTNTCPDGCCAAGEVYPDCGDCDPSCGINECEPGLGETCETCETDCKCTGSICSAGECKADNGTACTLSSECGSGNCIDMICCAASCAAPCQTCEPDGSACLDLPSSPSCSYNEACVDGLCQCADGVMNGGETGIDCGGDCVGHACVNEPCTLPEDCASSVCCDCGANGMLCEPDADCATNCPP